MLQAIHGVFGDSLGKKNVLLHVKNELNILKVQRTDGRDTGSVRNVSSAKSKTWIIHQEADWARLSSRWVGPGQPRPTRSYVAVC